MKITVHVIQYEHGGIPDEPDVFTDQKKAQAFYLSCCNDTYLISRHGHAEFKTVEEAADWMFSDDNHGDDNVRYWTFTINVPETNKESLRLHRAASRSLLAAYRKGKRNGGEMDWEDVDFAWEIALNAEKAERSANRKAVKK